MIQNRGGSSTLNYAFVMLLCLASLWASFVLATPVPEPEPQGFEKMGELSNVLAERQFDFNIVRNELGKCKPVTVIFARGTIELGNVGSITGPPFFNALDILLGLDKVAVQGVDYPATIEGYLKGGDLDGAQKFADLTNQAASQCPDTQIVWSGYSQGAQVAHLGAAKISSETAARVAAVVLFGDPKKDQPITNIDSGRVKTFCFPEDFICKMLPVVDTYHLSYAVNAIPAAHFVKSKIAV